MDLAGLRSLSKRVQQEVSLELRTRIGPDALGEMVRRAPVREGILRGSHSLHVGGERIATGADFGDSHADATPALGGVDTTDTSLAIVANTVYATAQHEGDYAHPKGGEKKWMERVLDENAGQYGRALGRAVKRGTEG